MKMGGRASPRKKAPVYPGSRSARCRRLEQLIDQATRLADSKVAELVSGGYDNLTVGTSTDSWWSVTSGNGVRFDRTTTVAAGSLAAAPL